jgi:hypothetical protein
MALDYTSTRLADDLMVPHAQIIKKLKKYAGSNKGKAGTIYKNVNPKRLSMIKLGRKPLGTTSVGKDGRSREDYETIYQFSIDDYETCVADEARYTEKSRAETSSRSEERYNKKDSKGNSTGLKAHQEKMAAARTKKK